ncbi:hypothetical protein F542_10720 [Bibersteinia trehalosi USDA-ARS-USMARC-188]|uniref:Uncharacterized protein n=3 Tax=Bibersteinia trehalosi TaxID=47735 RepID=W0R5I2_BIBTR|nr:hypothetical protein WQG_11340 [Bibersteinia trehalosi USDA-ARS-USMARC-192]AHG81790.1 hypothetical protein F542_10720 [Bibersteinia trehalosi USDA-ARS-USMARC-188]AHG84079.1 hypothetical protein F543_12150 [Bibersteinia trehalosi USDA-ARS-USMARC-189]AHG86399.1 hypothetical protein F544_11710 [Bibersteinia trehalosi USDA-ARS-USMARC-190]
MLNGRYSTRFLISCIEAMQNFRQKYTACSNKFLLLQAVLA